jgi:hypothetical protein
MTRNPLINALSATVYIVIISSLMFYGLRNSRPDDTIIAPILALSLFTLSAAVMTYVFGYQPFLLFVENKKKEAVDLFLRTVGIFGAITFIVLLILLLT